MSTELAQIAESTPSLPVRILSGSLRFTVRRPLAAAGLFIIILMCFMAAAAELITWYDPIEWRLFDKLSSPLTSSEREPFSTFLMGTDDKGRDIWAQMAIGAQVSLMVGFLSVAFGSGFGGVLGVISAWFGGKTDQVIQRVMDALMSIPTLILALAVTSVLGQTIENIIIAVGVVQIPRANRVVRAQALTVKETQYVDAARAIGANNIRIMVQHITPQCVAPFLIIATSALGIAILTEASLSYLGLGVPPPRPSWGGMLSGAARDYFILAPWMAIWPGVGLSLAVYGFNLFGDGLRDALDPRLRGT
ncbi:MAG: ABC transporter permease [SAR202 cluster bacterium]|nr:ABC transporter permease [SAR202 cluster bacterium]|tara:strand:- start:5448 stop:6365 length:918 start_codon:yes stop_codon:yes gene_type:complete